MVQPALCTYLGVHPEVRENACRGAIERNILFALGLQRSSSLWAARSSLRLWRSSLRTGMPQLGRWCVRCAASRTTRERLPFWCRYARIAAHAQAMGRPGLATLLLEHETRAAEQVRWGLEAATERRPALAGPL